MANTSGRTPAPNKSDGRKFYLKERLGAGAFGEVYLAEQDSGAGFRRRVALKLLNANVQGMAEAGRRMRDEARILGRLSHRHIVTVLDLVKLGNQWAVVMDYIPGIDLDRLIEALDRADERMPVPTALEIGAAVCEALNAAWHADDGKGNPLEVVHRDIKPSNILVTSDGDVKVLDFGVARVNLDTRESRTGLRVGTERYMSPQRIIGEDDELAGDVYAVAASVAEIVLRYPIGRTPVIEEKHAAFVENAMEALAAYLDGPPEAVEATLQLMRRGLDNDPEKRPSPREMADAFVVLARQLRGDPLAVFARRFIPECDRLLENRREVVDGVMSESGGRSLSPLENVPAPEDRGAYTQDPASFADEPEPAVPLAQEPAITRGLSTPVLLALIAGVLVVMLFLVALVGGLLAGGYATPVATAPAVETPVEKPAEKPIEAAPVPEPKPEIVAADVPKPEVAAPELKPAAKVPKPKPAKPAPEVAVVEPAVDPNAPRVDRALVVFPQASSVIVKCGDVSAHGTTSARIKNFPAGKCQVSAEYLGQTMTTQVAIDRAREVACKLGSGDRLECI